MEENTLIKVCNRTNGSVSYVIPDLGNLFRLFEKDEIKYLPFIELEKLSWIPGGKELIKECLIIDSKEALEALYIANEIEPEYFYTKEEVKELLLNGSLDELLDCLDFAPSGVIDTLKTLAVDLEINDVQKRKAIYNLTGFDVTKAIEFKNAGDEEELKTEEGKQRRIKQAKENQANPPSQRRTVAPDKYKIVG